MSKPVQPGRRGAVLALLAAAAAAPVAWRRLRAGLVAHVAEEVRRGLPPQGPPAPPAPPRRAAGEPAPPRAEVLAALGELRDEIELIRHRVEENSVRYWSRNALPTEAWARHGGLVAAEDDELHARLRAVYRWVAAVNEALDAGLEDGLFASVPADLAQPLNEAVATAGRELDRVGAALRVDA